MRSRLGRLLKKLFSTPEPNRNPEDKSTYYASKNSIAAFYGYTRDSETEKEKRLYYDIINKMLTMYNEGRRYVREFEDGNGNRYDGAFLHLISGTGSYKDRVIDEQYNHRAMPDETVEAIIEYKKAPLEEKDIDQIFRYMQSQFINKENLPEHCIICAPTITKQALEHMKNCIANDNSGVCGKLCLKFYNDTYDRPSPEEEKYDENTLRTVIDERTFNYIKSTSYAWETRDMPGYEELVEMFGCDVDEVWGSVPAEVLFEEEILEKKENIERIKRETALHKKEDRVLTTRFDKAAFQELKANFSMMKDDEKGIQKRSRNHIEQSR